MKTNFKQNACTIFALLTLVAASPAFAKTAGEKLDHAIDKTERAADSAKDKAKEKAHNAKEKAHDLKESAKSKAHKGIDKL